ncbi:MULTISPECIES: TetR/AcrR family transcriptional regulator [Mesorhizobium]|uniref:TetR/AcrR family transcriptional regulator n=1 Tax=Mesorhizobium denitrificans TaxID=2294114 RepID=A0A371XJL4_9HYPH|nr:MULTISPECIES: TetR/AcrR family transcriptional regulator [Mesorhizobium]RFC69415.1 TetR/AcrR family transcriptional regulator [Mesorhizobium denitrificans]
MTTGQKLTQADGGRAEPPVFMRYADYLKRGLDTLSFGSKGDRTRYRLKIAAARALEEVGYTDLKVSDVCSNAGVALGTFYVYYKDKNEIAIEVVIDFVTHMYETARQVGHGRSDFDAILNTNRAFVAMYEANPGLMKCHVQLQSQLSEFQDIWRPMHQKWIETLGRSIARRSQYKGGIGSPVGVARALEGMVFYYLYSVIVSQDHLFEEEDPSRADNLALMLSSVWYRAVYCKDPPVEEVEAARHQAESVLAGK